MENETPAQPEELHSRVDLIRDQLGPCFEEIAQHLPTLSRRRQQLVTTDHYGNQQFEAWLQEIDYFMKTKLVGGSDDELQRMKSIGIAASTYNRLVGVIERASSTFGILAASVRPRSWEEMDPIEFEMECCRLFQLGGWDAQTTQSSGDQGVDIIGHHQNQKIVVQCKRYAGSVGNSAVQEIIAGRDFEKADLAVVVATGTFTKSAHELAASTRVTLIHPDDLFAALEIDRTKLQTAIPTDEIPAVIDLAIHETVEAELKAEAEQTEQAAQETDCMDDEELYQQAIDVLKATKRATTANIQRRLRIGYNRAARIIDVLEDNGIVGPENGSSPREILVDLDSL